MVYGRATVVEWTISIAVLPCCPFPAVDQPTPSEIMTFHHMIIGLFPISDSSPTSTTTCSKRRNGSCPDGVTVSYRIPIIENYRLNSRWRSDHVRYDYVGQINVSHSEKHRQEGSLAISYRNIEWHNIETYVTYTHMETKELTYEDQYNWVNRIN